MKYLSYPPLRSIKTENDIQRELSLFYFGKSEGVENNFYPSFIGDTCMAKKETKSNYILSVLGDEGYP